ncbi:MAG: N(4)-(beta-N-acetylglucosaminyl)-L-asparaginase [Gemmatimonadetes bacterium]|nr:N(4)-(beta-N-acetylglucosaminyl)-L-asparaginase [Gemmatimonadota bacterium]
MSPIVISTWRFGLSANQPAWKILKNGGSALDAVVRGAEVAERDPEVKSVGFGGYPNAEGEVEVDAAVVDGHSLGYGAVAGLRNIATPTAVARCVMEKTDHVFLVGNGALKFARTQGFEECNMLTEHGRRAWEKWKRERTGPPADVHDTIGLVALDQQGNLAAACTTSGAAFKLPGRVGDSPLIGSGLYADNDAGAAAATGRGEEITRTCGSFAIVEHMRHGKSPQEACEAVVQYLIARVPSARPYQMAYIAIDKYGNWGAAAARSGFLSAVTSNVENQLYKSRYFIGHGGVG